MQNFPLKKKRKRKFFPENNSIFKDLGEILSFFFIIALFEINELLDE